MRKRDRHTHTHGAHRLIASSWSDVLKSGMGAVALSYVKVYTKVYTMQRNAPLCVSKSAEFCANMPETRDTRGHVWFTKNGATKHRR